MTDPVLVIAEAGVNHNGSLEMARRLIDAAADAGADLVKFQSFRAELLVTRRAEKAAYQVTNTGQDGDQLAMLKGLELSLEDTRAVVEHCRDRGIRFMSTAFDMPSLHFLAGLDMPAVKIPSGDLTYGPMLLAAARLGRPLIVSTGMATLGEVDEALSVIAFGLTRDGDPADRTALEAARFSAEGQAALEHAVTLLHCTTQYPAPPKAVNLRAMDAMAEAFGLRVGYSDHTSGTAVSVAAVARGATVIEKHFTLDRTLPGPDHAASLEPAELASMIADVRTVEAALGSARKGPDAIEVPNRRIARRSLVAARPIAAGTKMVADDLTAKRPADGLCPMRRWDLIGRVADRDYDPDDLVAP